MNVAAIPAEIRARAQWVVWRLEERAGKATKVPYRADAAGRASASDPSTWSTFDAAVEAASNPLGGADGIGFVFSTDDPFVGVDLDAGLSDSDRGAIMAALDSYAETSVSGTGVHVIVRASLNGRGRNRSGPFEVYDAGRYFVVTGDHVRGTPTTVEERQTQLEEVLGHFLPPREPLNGVEQLPPQPVDLDDVELIEKAMSAKSARSSAPSTRGAGRTDTRHSRKQIMRSATGSRSGRAGTSTASTGSFARAVSTVRSGSARTTARRRSGTRSRGALRPIRALPKVRVPTASRLGRELNPPRRRRGKPRSRPRVPT